MGSFSRQFEPFYRETRRDIFAFCRALNFKPSWQQKLLLDAVQQGHTRIAVKSGQGPGKTTATAVIGLWRAWRAPKALTIITAPTMKQCKDVWLVEARRRLDKAHDILKRFIKITKSKVEIGDDPDWGVKLVTASREENAQGFHEENMTVIAEEASGIPREIVTQFKGTLSNNNSLFIMIGNPNSRDCAFFDCFNRERHRWKCITFNAEESPPHIVNQDRNKLLEEEFGRESDTYRIRVLGEFPFNEPNCVMSTEDCELCTGRENADALMYKHVLSHRDAKFGGGRAKQFGIDLARFGSDESTVWRRSGNSIVEWKVFNHTEPAHVIWQAFRMQDEAGWSNKDCSYVVDAGGMGQGVMHLFYEAGKNLIEFHNNGKAANGQQYANKITEAMFEFSKTVRRKNCFIPNDAQLIMQLCNRQYFTNKDGKFILETKEEYVKRDNVSPDRADGCVMAFYDQPRMVGNLALSADASHRVGDVGVRTGGYR